MVTNRREIPSLEGAAGIYGGGDSVTGAFCVVIAILIFAAQPQ